LIPKALLGERHMIQKYTDPTQLGFIGRTLLGAYLLVLSGLLAYSVVGIWPSEFSRAEPDPQGEVNLQGNVGLQGEISLFGQRASIPAELNLVLVAMLVGALGGNVHAIRSFAVFVGNRRLVSSWVWWYIMRPFVGLPVALIFYFAIRAGFLSAGATAADINPFGISAVAGLVGLFSDHAVVFLREAFHNLFKVEEPEKLADPLPTDGHP
jgi:hypothetical protein